MTIDRRDLLRAGMAAGAFAAAPRWLHALERPAVAPATAAALTAMPIITDPSVRELAFRAVEAARSGGASYADVRLTHTRHRRPEEKAWLDVGVRALVNGYWGFAAGTLWTPDEMSRLGREAAAQAKLNAVGKPRPIELGRIPVVKDGHWTMPVERDPFETVPREEILDFWESLRIYAARKTRGDVWQRTPPFSFQRQDKAFASSEGSYCTQRLYLTAGSLAVAAGSKIGAQRPLSLDSEIIAGAGRGWEYIARAPLREEVDRLVEEMRADLALPLKPVEVGRYDVVFDAHSMANLLDGTLGAATELDRALGYEANAGGTSYINDPLGMLGRYEAGGPLLTVAGERSAPGALATVKWDDEGVAPEDFTLVKDGVLVDFPTHREATGWLQDRGRRSHGCAAAPRAFDAPLIHTPNLTLAPGTEALDFEGLVGGMKRGLAVKGLSPFVDFQCLNGTGVGRVYEVKDGKRVARIGGAGFLFRAPELWKSLRALGGAASREPFALRRAKGEPAQETWHTVTAVPGVVNQVTTIEVGRKA